VVAVHGTETELRLSRYFSLNLCRN